MTFVIFTLVCLFSIRIFGAGVCDQKQGHLRHGITKRNDNDIQLLYVIVMLGGCVLPEIFGICNK